MKKSAYKSNGRSRIFLAFLCVGLLTSVGFLINYKTRAEAESSGMQPAYKNNYALKSFNPTESESAQAVNVGERASIWLKLEAGKPLDTTFYGKELAISALQSNLAEPVSQASADFNSDGYADLVGGFRNAAGGGLIALYRANREAFAPQDAQVRANLQKGVFPAPFEKDALITEVPGAPDFIAAGKFSQDSAFDLVFASRGGRVIYLMTSDGKGGFNAPQEIAVGGEITALASQRLDYSGPYDGIVAAVDNGKSASLLVFSSNNDLPHTTPRVVPVESAVSSIILAKTEPGAAGVELFGLADGKIFTISDIANAEGNINQIELPYRAVDFAVGNFIADRRAKNEIAVLAENGNVNYLTDGTLDTRPLTKEEVGARVRKYGRRSVPVKPDNSPENWTESESYQLGVYAVQNGSSGLLRKAYISGYETDDLMVVNQAAQRVEVLFKEPNRAKNRTSFTGEVKNQIVDFANVPEMILPMRLNVMGQQGFVSFSKGSIEPTTIIAAPNPTINVTSTADVVDAAGGVCANITTASLPGPNGVVSLREAVCAANKNPGLDTINVPAGTYQLTIAGGNENAAATGDLDILDAVTVVGNGSGSTFVQAGASAGTGIDKVFSVNPNLNLSFATSMSNLTIRFGNNTTDGFGGAMDWDAGNSAGTITIDNVIATGNTVGGGGLGGGGFLFTSANVPGSGSATITNSTISNNIGATATASGVIGGGIYVQYTPFSMSNVIVNANSSKNAGGGLYIEPVNSPGATGSSTFTNTTFTNNTTTAAGADGGGIYTLRGLVFSGTTIISNNSSTRFGGGISSSVINSSVNVNKATMVGNSAATNGGAIEVGTITTGNVFNMTFSRIVGNTSAGFTGLVSRGGTATVQNNWWGCNTGPSAAPCDTAGVIAPGTVNFTPWLRYTHTANPSSIVVGQNSTLTVSFLTNSNNQAIAASNLDVLFGLPVTFNSIMKGTVSPNPATIQNTGMATATFTSTSPGVGSANAVFDNGTATASITINQAAPTTTVTSNANPSVFGQTVTFTATVSGGVSPTGTVQFKDGAATIAGCGAVTLSGGTAQCSTTTLTVGSHTITAVYSGDTNNTASTSPNLTQTVNQANTTTTITADNPDPSNVGQSVTVTYTVTVNSPGAGTPTGNVTVSDGVNSCTGTVAAGNCAITLNTPGARTLTAAYAGDTNFAGSTSAGASHTVQITADLAITKTDGVTTVTAGGSTTYTITASNAGPNTATGATVADTFPASLTCTFTAAYAGGATGPASGSGNINAAVNLPSGGSATFTASCTISAAATGTLSNTATVTAPTGVTDPTPGNNSATDSDTIAQSADLAITKTDGVTTVTAGGGTTYTITASNAGPSNATGATVTDTFPAALTATWTCVGAGGGTCTASGSGNINQSVNLPSGGSVTFTVSATISALATGTLSNTATVTAPTGVTDPTPGNNSATDSDTILVTTAAAVEVGGRVMTNTGRGISGARVTITDSSGNSRLAATSAFGYFRFADVQAGETYIISVNSKRYSFAPQVISLTGDLTDLNFVAHE